MAIGERRDEGQSLGITTEANSWEPRWPVNEGLSVSGSVFQHPNAQSKRQALLVSLSLTPAISILGKTGKQEATSPIMMATSGLHQAAPSQSLRAF